ncbi:MAG TPA: DUF5700 domain-containing putative Zn-dependent protease [Candidatus Sulfotelmatobacter sp.]|nr:DUF5700 domain-containing putative Zn-dependent protease [Candidatus Sulfotelmatobacter sp.]
MSAPRLLALIPFLFVGLVSAVSAQSSQTTATPRIQLQLNTDEAEAVLDILDKGAAGTAIGDSDWQRLFTTEPYVRLKKREAGMHRDFTDDDFKTFVSSPELAARASSLQHTLDAWRRADLTASARRVLAYLPEEASIKAKVLPVIKPKTNSFVFETTTDPAIFLYLDPEESAAKFENTVAHELHHIGYSSVQSLAEAMQKDLPPNVKPAVEWMGAFGEGFAMLAAAGGPEVDPHTSSSPKEHARWDHDLANFNLDLDALQLFFLDIVNQKLVEKDKIDERAYAFFGDAQGPWYTVGYKMAVTIEKRYGRKRLIECMLDPRELLATYNRAAAEINSVGKERLALWSPELMQKIGLRLTQKP